MDEALYHELADQILQDIQDAIESADDDGVIDANLEDGVLTIVLPDGGEYVINKHSPSKQIWLSSPDSGASHFKYDEDDGSWMNSSGEFLAEKIAEEIARLTGVTMDL